MLIKAQAVFTQDKARYIKSGAVGDAVRTDNSRAPR